MFSKCLHKCFILIFKALKKTLKRLKNKAKQTYNSKFLTYLELSFYEYMF